MCLRQLDSVKTAQTVTDCSIMLTLAVTQSRWGSNQLTSLASYLACRMSLSHRTYMNNHLCSTRQIAVQCLEIDTIDNISNI